jgi:hypothetical protein
MSADGEPAAFRDDLARRALLVLLTLVLGFLPACRHCGPPDETVARLVELHGPVSKELAKQPQSWHAAPAGISFAVGDAVRTETGASARVDLVAGGHVQLTERTTVRFLADGVLTRHLSVETGEAEVEPGDSAIRVETLIGMAQIEPGSRVRLARDGQRLTFDVLIGGAQFDSSADGGATKEVKAGHRFQVSIGGAGVETDLGVPGSAPEKALADADAPPHDAARADAPSDAGAEPVVAVVQGPGVRASASRAAALAGLAEGTTELAVGSHLVVPDGATVTVSRGAERLTVVGGSDIDIGAADGPLLRVSSGRVVVKSQKPGTRVRVPGGTIELVAAGTGDVQADVRVERKTARVVSNRGELLLHGDVRVASVGPGESGTIDARGDATTDALTAKAADASLAAGESATIHSPTGVAAVHIRRDDCSGDSLVQITSGTTVRRTFARADDEATGIVRLPAGRHDYSVSCVDSADGAPEEHGSVRILTDSGVAHFERNAATNVVDADGRHYHVLYQSLLPQMTFHWAGAPRTGTVTFHASAATGAVKRSQAVSGNAALPAGSMGEGTYRFWFDVDGHPDQRSPETTLVIGFDNAAPAAEIQTPRVGQPLSPTVHVSGVAPEGSQVSVSGVAIPVDAQGRFGGDVPGPPPDHRVIAVRISHPVRGIHYFVRTFVPAAKTE